MSTQRNLKCRASAVFGTTTSFPWCGYGRESQGTNFAARCRGRCHGELQHQTSRRLKPINHVKIM
jgi:hypothetical protein